MTLSQSGHRIITVFGCSFAIFSITLASCSWCSLGPLKVNPAIAVERGARDGMIAALRSLNLDLEPLRDRADHASPFRRKL
jgi:hypothetical protein